MTPSPPADPPFEIISPSADDVLIPDFSVWGSCPSGTTDIVIQLLQGGQPVFSLPPITPPPTAMSWEGIFTGIPAGTYDIRAISGGTPTPTIPNVQVNARTGLTVDMPSPIPTANTEQCANPWHGWQVTGKYDPTQVQFLQIFITQNGATIPTIMVDGEKVPEPTLAPAILCQSAGEWQVNLGFVTPEDTGNGFCVHIKATTLKGSSIYGSTANFFSISRRDGDRAAAGRPFAKEAAEAQPA